MGEKELDEFFSQWYNIQPVDREMQRQGIDRIFTRHDNDHVFKVEYKTDWKATKTQNAFVELISVDSIGKPGWAYSSQADYLLYYLPEDILVYVIAFGNLRNCLPAWVDKYPERTIRNAGYNTVGVLTPLCEFERIATQVICL